MTNEARKIARLRLLKRIGIIGLATSGALGLVFFVLSLLPQGNAAFTMRIDNPTSVQNSTFRIFSSAKEAMEDDSTDSVTYLSGEPLGNVGLTDAKAVERHLDSVENFEGNNNFANESNKQLAMVYSMYLTNTTEEDIYVQYAVRLDAYKESTEEMSSPIEYFRVLVQTEEVGYPETISNVYYGNRATGRFTSYIYDSEDGREPIYTYSALNEEDMYVHIKSDLQSAGNDGYCINFNDYKITKDIVVSEVKVPVKKALRYTFVAFFDGTDVDSYVRAQSDDYLLLSLHFGV